MSKEGKMKWPDKINIQGTVWTLDVREIGKNLPPVNRYGEMDDSARRISIYLTGQPVEDFDTFLHEVLESGILQGLDLGTVDDREKEVRIRGIARFLAQVLVGNNLIKGAV